ncbi:MAG: hypothetical protein HPY62_12970 [Bacteroidales bacterium]|nr:hypothetical protein [Bacteroidales bacterium]
MKRLILYFLFAVLPGYGTALLLAQTEIDPSETSSTVLQLSEFHSVIYPMWHDAYPAKNFEALKGFVPQIKTHVEALNSAKLPGILREREQDWKKLMAELNSTAQQYYSAAGSNNNEALLTAAEQLHSVYERLNRVIRPVLKEIDDFHQTLYIVYHKYYPEKKYDQIAGLSDDLISKARAISNYPSEKLKQRLGDSTSRYETLANDLLNSALELKKTLSEGTPENKDKAVEKLHTAYQNLDGLFH